MKQCSHTSFRSDFAAKSPSCRRVKRFRFTLIELLVVISIIAILAAMLLPALTKTRQISQNAGCKSNMRQFALGYSLYVNTYNDWLPTVRLDSKGAYLSFQEFAKLTNIDSASRMKTYICPAPSQSQGDIDRRTTSPYSSFGDFVLNVVGTHNKGVRHRTLHRIQIYFTETDKDEGAKRYKAKDVNKPSICVSGGESNRKDGLSAGYPSYFSFLRHKPYSNFFFFDMHIASVDGRPANVAAFLSNRCPSFFLSGWKY